MDSHAHYSMPSSVVNQRIWPSADDSFQTYHQGLPPPDGAYTPVAPSRGCGFGHDRMSGGGGGHISVDRIPMGVLCSSPFYVNPSPNDSKNQTQGGRALTHSCDCRVLEIIPHTHVAFQSMDVGYNFILLLAAQVSWKNG